MKEQDKSPEEELDETNASNLSDRDFRVMIIKTLNSMIKDIETIKRGQSEIKAISEINTTWEGINSRLDEAEDGISVLEDKVGKNNQAEYEKEIRV